jgi:hypothetical protein
MDTQTITQFNWAMVTAISATITVIILIFWRTGIWRWLMSLSPLQARLEVFDGSFSRATGANSPGVVWYSGRIKMSITPWVHTGIKEFYIEIRTGNELQKSGFSLLSKDQYGTPTSLEIGSGYNLDPDNPIILHDFSFEFMVRNGEEIELKANIILRVGIRNYRKSITLKLT